MPGAGELVIVANPDGESSLRYLLRLPIAGGLVFRTAGTWLFPSDGRGRPLELVSLTPAKTGVLVCTYRPVSG